MEGRGGSLDEIGEGLAGAVVQREFSCSERGRAVEYHALTGLRMVDLQPLGMQGQSRAGVECLFMGVEPVAQQRMADAEHVHAQLVGASGYGGQLHPAVIAKAFQDLPEGLRRLAQLMVDNVPGFVRGRSEERRAGKEWRPGL